MAVDTATVEAPPEGTETQPPETVVETAPESPETPEEPSQDTSPSTEDTGEETPTAPPVEEPEAPVETPEVIGEVSEPALVELDDSTINSIVEVYGDKIFESPAFKDRADQHIKSQADRQIAAADASRNTQVEADKIIRQGETALNKITGHLEKVQGLNAQLDKVRSGEAEIDTLSTLPILDGAELKQALVAYGQATSATGTRSYENGLNSAFITTFSGEVLPGLTKNQAEEIKMITGTAARIQADPNQGEQPARTYLFANLFRFIAERGVELGATKERIMTETKKSLAEKIAGKNVQVAAVAKAKAEEQSPPVAPESRPTEANTGATLELYNKLKGEGKTAEAQDVLNRMAARRR